MRGVPNRPVRCASCGNNRGCAKDSLCHKCRLAKRPNGRKKFFWTAELETRLRRIYQSASNRDELTRGLDYMQCLSGFTRVVIVTRAREMGLTYVERRLWTERELDFLRDNMGTLSKAAIAKQLRRSHYSVKARAALLGLFLRVLEGYSREELRQLIGVGSAEIRKWIQNGWIKIDQDRITENSVRLFLRQHPEKYKLSRVDEAWYKGLLFPSFGRSRYFESNEKQRSDDTVIHGISSSIVKDVAMD
jgi:hypothetical protein